jgi:hypothetical protein
MTVFSLALVAVTPVVVGRWLTLDAVLDGVLEADGLEAHERVVPLASWDGNDMHADVPTSEMAARGLVHVASALMPFGAVLPLDGDPNGAVLASRRPRVREYGMKRGFRPVNDFPDPLMPFADGRGKPADRIDTKRGPAVSRVETVRCLAPGRMEWIAQGDPDRVVAILREAVGIGGKTRKGFGRFDPGSLVVRDLGDRAHPLAGILAAKGDRLCRPVPAGMFPDGAGASRLSVQTCRSPYWDGSAAEAARVPLTRHHDGIFIL